MNKPLKLANIAQNGDNLETLRALRQTLAEAIDRTTSGRDIASLSRQLQIVIEKISELEAQDSDDEIARIIKGSARTMEDDIEVEATSDDEEIFDNFDYNQ